MPDALPHQYCRDITDPIEAGVNIEFARFGRRQTRISVEITVHPDAFGNALRPACVHFERFESGKLDVPDVGLVAALLVVMLLLVVPVGLVILLIAWIGSRFF